MATIEDLPSELLLVIFSHYVQNEGRVKFLRNVPRVCKKWNKLSSDASLWENVKFFRKISKCQGKCRDLDHLLKLSRSGFLYHTQSLEGAFCDSDVNLSPVLENIRDLKALYLEDVSVDNDTIKHVTEHCPNLERLHLWFPTPTTLHQCDQFLTVCGPTLKHLDLKYFCSPETGQQLLSAIAAKCPQLEVLVFFIQAPFPIYELRSGCPRLRELDFAACPLIDAGKDDSLGCGFKYLKTFKANWCDFNGLNIYTLLKDSVNLEHLELVSNKNLVSGNILKIPSDNVKVLHIFLNEQDKKLKVLSDVVYKWRRTLTVLNLRHYLCDISRVVKSFLHDNSNPQLQSFSTFGNGNPRLFKKFIQMCQNLIYLEILKEDYEGRKEIERRLKELERIVKIAKEHYPIY